MKSGTWVTIIILIGVIALSYYAINKNGASPNDEFAKCVAEKATLYMQTGCFECQKQEEIFGSSYKHLKKINCALTPAECAKEGVVRTPTWIIGYEKHIRYKTLEQLSELTGCELKETKNGTD